MFIVRLALTVAALYIIDGWIDSKIEKMVLTNAAAANGTLKEPKSKE